MANPLLDRTTVTFWNREEPRWIRTTLDEIRNENEIVKKKHPMNSKYPHECFNFKDANTSHNIIEWKDYLYANGFIDKIGKDTPMPLKAYFRFLSKYKHLKKLWKDPRIKLYCCNCYQKM